MVSDSTECDLELVLTQDTWRRTLRACLRSPGSCAMGAVRSFPSPKVRELLCERLEPASATPPTGLQLPPLAEFCVFSVQQQRASPSELAATATDWLARIAPRRSQIAAMILLTIRENGRTTCEAVVSDTGQLQPLRRIRIIGSGMLQLVEDEDQGELRPESDAVAERIDPERIGRPGDGGLHEPIGRPVGNLSHGDDDRWSRTAGAITPAVLTKLRHATVTIVGAGRNGSLLAWELAALGVGQLRIVDADILAAANLDAMLGLLPADIGRTKAEALAERLVAYRPDLAVTCLARSATDRDAMELLRRRADLLVTCVDSNLARMAVSLIARERLMVHLDVGTSVQARRSDAPSIATETPSRRSAGRARESRESARRDPASRQSRTAHDASFDAPDGRTISGDVRLLLPGDGCVACVGGVSDLEDVLYDLAAPPGALRRGRPVTWSEQRAGSLISINSMAVGVAVQTFLDLLGGQLRSSYWHRLEWHPGRGLQADSAPVGATETCPFCRRDEVG